MKDEFDEERSLWNQIKSDARHIDQLMVRIYYTPSAALYPAYYNMPSRELKALEDTCGYRGIASNPGKPKNDHELWADILQTCANIDSLMVCGC